MDALSTTDNQLQSETDSVEVNYSGPFAKDTKELIKRNWSAIKSFKITNRYSKVYNLRIKQNDIVNTLQCSNLLSIFDEQNLKFKCNASIGFILINQDNQTLRYWHASVGQDKLFDSPYLIESKNGFDSMLADLSSKD